jgi:hypothetical protein
MRRFSAETVKAAYETTGLSPTRSLWFGDGCACGLTAVMVAEKRLYLDDLDDDLLEDMTYGFVAKKLEVPEDYVNGFARGFDGYGGILMASDDFQAGDEDGRAAWEAVRGDL